MNDKTSPLSSLNFAFIEGLYADFARDPNSVPEDWREYFDGLGNGEKARFGPSFESSTIFNPPIFLSPGRKSEPLEEEAQLTSLQDRVDQLVRAYRTRGHMIAQLDPLDRPRPIPAELDPSYYGFTESDFERVFSCLTVSRDQALPLRKIIEVLQQTYCRSIGVEYMHIEDVRIRRWLQARMEQSENRLQITRKEQLRILTRLTDAVTFEEFIRKKFIGAKSFSLEGSESLIPLLDLAIERAGEQGIEQIVMGMAHRGRLNVLANIMGKSPREIFREFADADPELYVGRGDVKYHKGYRNNWKLASGKLVNLTLCFNPSHLEFVNPVALGRTRAKQDRSGDVDHKRGLALLIHGDASFAGQGVVQETLNLSQLGGFAVGGTLHIIVNNQIGFTTGPLEGRSSAYCTDVAKMLAIPIFHVNGEDPEAVAQCVQLALDFRQEFQRDVVVDMYGYRRLGHNEADEPSFTQPLLYKAIEKRKPVREGYLEHLLKLGGVTPKDAERIAEKRHEHFENALNESRSKTYKAPSEDLGDIWRSYVGGPDEEVVEPRTTLALEKIKQLLLDLTKAPEGFSIHPKISRLLDARRKMAEGQEPLDWAAGEALALGSVSCEGYRVRLSGQDSGRGTFSHRHAILHDYETGQRHIPLRHLAPDQGPVDIINSPLSETGVLGFEYGYTLDCPNGLILWEAQFGDFWNVAQVIVDQFIASAEDKWRHLSGLVMLLPHGFEGQGPEHSSARIERFLNLAAEDNIQIVYPTTPAQFFHVLRRQVLRKWRKPLVVMTPKSLLRHPEVVSPLEQFVSGAFQRIIPDDSSSKPEEIQKILLCAGKIYYELRKRREVADRKDVAIIRIEQLYPFQPERLRKVLSAYKEGTPVFWVQEEPENMGAWRYFRVQFGERLLNRFPFAGIFRPASASPATGSANAHKHEQEQILAEAIK